MGTNSRVVLDENCVNQMNYLKCVVRETLRLHPPVPLLVAWETSSSVKLRGYHTTTKIMVFINASTIQRDTKLWDDPGEFIPKRFETNQVDFNGQDFQLISFSIGRKGCPTMSFGLASAQYVLSNLLYWFNWKMPKFGILLMHDADMSETNGLTVNKKIQLHLVP